LRRLNAPPSGPEAVAADILFAGVATQIAWILFVVGLALAVIFAIGGRRRPL